MKRRSFFGMLAALIPASLFGEFRPQTVPFIDPPKPLPGLGPIFDAMHIVGLSSVESKFVLDGHGVTRLHVTAECCVPGCCDAIALDDSLQPWSVEEEWFVGASQMKTVRMSFLAPERANGISIKHDRILFLG